MAEQYKRIETKLIHAGEPVPRINGAVCIPIFQSAMFEYAGETSYHDLKYIRLNNTPNHLALSAKLAALENAEAAVIAASGMGAISTALLAILSAGDHVLVSEEPFASGSLDDVLNQPGVWSMHLPDEAGTPTTLDVGEEGRYVRVQLAGHNPLSLAEVQVFGE